MKDTPLGTNQAEFEFLRTEIHTGLTLAKIALEAHYKDKTDRNRTNARKAYNAVMHFLANASLTSDEEDEINTGLARLKSDLEQLGETL